MRDLGAAKTARPRNFYNGACCHVVACHAAHLQPSNAPSLRTMLAPPPAARVHTVFCAECTEDYDYKSLGVFHSHNLSGMPGGVTRLLACDKEELKTYRGLHIGPTFVHQNHKRIWHTRALGPGETDHPFGAARNDSSGSYNKPGSIMHWVLESEEAKHVDYVLYIDADMLLRLPMDPVKMGVKPGVVVSEHVGYLDVGLRNGLQHMFLPPEAAEYAGADVNVLARTRTLSRTLTRSYRPWC